MTTYDNFLNLAFYLDEIYSKEVDLVTTNGLSPYITAYIKEEVIWC